MRVGSCDRVLRCYRTMLCVSRWKCLLLVWLILELSLVLVLGATMCDRCHINGRKDNVWLILFWRFLMLKNQCLCVTGGVSQEPRCCMAVYLSLSFGEFTSTLSHMCGSWYFPIFLFRDGSLNLMRMTSLIDLAIFCSLSPQCQSF